MAKDLLKEAIADAKAVREVALQNAKMALEEAFDSKIKNMLSARLAEELEEDVELEEVYDENENDGMDEEINLDELMSELEEMDYDEDEYSMEEDIDLSELMAELEEDDDEGEDETMDEGVADAVKKIKDMAAYLKDTKIAVDDDELMAIIKADGEKTTDLGKLFQKLAAVGFVSKSTGKGKEFGATAAGADMGTQSFKKEGEDFDIDALISEIEAELGEGKKKENNDEALEEARRRAKQAEKELDEALATVSSLRESISEMNLLNSKLLYCNKLFRANSLTEAQKVKVIDALDMANTANEAKLVYNTLQESFKFTGVEKKSIQEGLARASKPAGIAPKKVITESVDDTVSRFQKLANIQL